MKPRSRGAQARDRCRGPCRPWRLRAASAASMRPRREHSAGRRKESRWWHDMSERGRIYGDVHLGSLWEPSGQRHHPERRCQRPVWLACRVHRRDQGRQALISCLRHPHQHFPKFGLQGDAGPVPRERETAFDQAAQGLLRVEDRTIASRRGGWYPNHAFVRPFSRAPMMTKGHR
jgi:hypothetical protein